MAHDVINICNHNLPTHDVVALANEISQRFKMDIEYGYLEKIEGEQFMAKEGMPYFIANDDYKKLGIIRHPNPAYLSPPFKAILIDEFYQTRPLYKTKQNDSLTLEEQAFFEEGICVNFREFELEIINTEINESEAGHTLANCRMNEHSAYLYKPYFSMRWFNFKRNFTVYDESDIKMPFTFPDDLMAYRKEVLQIMGYLGGTEAIYFDDQGIYQEIEVMCWNHSWQQVKDYVLGLNQNCIHVSDFMKNYSTARVTNEHMVLFDDFNDLHSRCSPC